MSVLHLFSSKSYLTLNLHSTLKGECTNYSSDDDVAFFTSIGWIGDNFVFEATFIHTKFVHLNTFCDLKDEYFVKSPLSTINYVLLICDMMSYYFLIYLYMSVYNIYGIYIYPLFICF